MRLPHKRAMVVGAGQTPGSTIGNGRAIATLFAREGAQVLCVDRDADRAQAVAAETGGAAFQADITAPGVGAAIVTARRRNDFGGLMLAPKRPRL